VQTSPAEARAAWKSAASSRYWLQEFTGKKKKKKKNRYSGFSEKKYIYIYAGGSLHCARVDTQQRHGLAKSW